ncbi:MBL fold metallo-hydrolase [Nocardioides sp. MAH-18]|uniref:MBL fold metallo-hydrolase n=1 Tax=Nocardioides agri TaxID=2682843 RepID=A0A6L6XMD7_9ACTN|nr:MULTISPECIES: MBL fold metallo-hydrolase [unclassified Nocardioides]MBA2953239.1 MBL fold metallo-hydrolase [Nocardioides sp. CGMCC 1.13656]MVQ48108.1 MBL fold metallo-hydrolase [Nocardioides sp. MAH-18]
MDDTRAARPVPRTHRRPVLTFLGAAGTVTGSRFLVESDACRLLVDAGLYQGPSALRRLNWEPSEVPASELAAVVVSHAHLDHCGYLPRLVKEGFSGRVLCTPETAELVEIVLRDSAHLQEEDARFANASGFSRHRPALPLYDVDDVERTLRLIAPVGFGEEVEAGPGARVVLRPAGHILGSSTVHLDVDGATVVLSGDLGRPTHPLLNPPPPPTAASTAVIESTYGDRLHPAPTADVLAAAVRRTVGRGGSVLIPAFAVDRTELVLLQIHQLMESGAVPRVPVFVDSPMALATLRVYRAAIHAGSAELRPAAAKLLTAVDSLRVREVRDAEGSMRLNRPGTSCIIISASGMATGGRVIHHLKHQLPQRRNCVVLTGYQAVGTRGRQLLDGAPQVKIHGRYVPVRAEIVDDATFSVHADADELVAWLGSASEPPQVAYVVHGEADASHALAQRIHRDLGITAVVPRRGERVRLD